jgi:hypothetical protein
MARSVRVRGHLRSGRRVRGHVRHLYSNPADRRAAEAEFERRYGARRGRYIYGATVGQVRRERAALRARRRRER